LETGSLRVTSRHVTPTEELGQLRGTELPKNTLAALWPATVRMWSLPVMAEYLVVVAIE
jgi:hypothetical protein